MSIVFYTQQDEFDLVNTGQDCIGWKVVDQAGTEVGTVKEMMIQTDEMKVDSIVVAGIRVPAEDITLQDGRVVVRGILHDGQFTEAQKAAKETAATKTYEPYKREANARNVAGVTRAANDDEISIPIIEEQLQIGKRTVESGKVNVRTNVTERPVEENVTLREETVNVTRHDVNRPLDANATANAFQEGTFEVTTQAEVPVVSKQARVVEEVIVDKETAERTETVRDTVKRTDVDIDETDTNKTTNRRNG